MTTIGYEREYYYNCLRELELQVARDIRFSVGPAIDDWLAGPAHWAVDGGYGERVRRVRSAIDLSQSIVLRRLEEKLAGISLRMAWPILCDICCDIGLYMGGGALAGGAAGAGIGFSSAALAPSRAPLAERRWARRVAPCCWACSA